MSQTPYGKSSIIPFQGRSGERYRFQAWPMDTKFRAVGGIYLVTRRECLDRTFQSKASHRCLAIGQTADLATSALTRTDLAKLEKQGANCICVLAVPDEARRLEIEKDLIEGNEQRGARLQYLFHPSLPETAPGASGDS